MHLSLVIPAYNEALRIGTTLEQVRSYLARQDYDSEIIVVDDGSRDETAAVVGTFEGVRLVRLDRNRGKGAATRRGMLTEAKGAYRFYYDADASTPIAEVETCWPRFAAGAEIVIGSRALAASRIEIRQAWYRQSMGRVYNVILRSMGLTPFLDTQCGFKGFTARAVEICFSRQTLDGFSFDAELLHIAALHGLRIDEVPVRWLNSPKSRVNPVTDSTRMFFDLLRVRANAAAGRYA
jgi:dolichyl-phosphate beta-glucosyltransferase